MDASQLDQLKYPIGRFSKPLQPGDEGQRIEWIGQIQSLPEEFHAAVQNLRDEQLNTPYREGGWTVRQLVHHVADSHLNSQIRFRWALTEDNPKIKVYDEKLWAELPDAKSLPIEVSLRLLNALHQRWTGLLKQMSDSDFRRTLIHPESGEQSLDSMLALYAWHGRHHLAHIQALKERNGW